VLCVELAQHALVQVDRGFGVVQAICRDVGLAHQRGDLLLRLAADLD
jgi:hypothetical protein